MASDWKKEKLKIDAIPTMNGFANVVAFKKVPKKAKADLAAKEKFREEWRRPDRKTEAACWRIPANVKKRAGTRIDLRRKEIGKEVWN